MQQQINTRIQKIIRTKYNQSQQSLDLSLFSNTITIPSSIILSYQDWSKLRILALINNQIQDQGIGYIASMNWSNLEKLFLQGNYITQVGINEFVKNRWPMLTDLDISSNTIGDIGAELLIKQERSRLSEICFRKDGLTKNFIHSIRSCNLSKIKVLQLNQNYIGCAGIKILIKIQLTNICQLAISKCKIGNQGAKALAKGKWNNLRLLNIQNDKIGIDGYTGLAEGNYQNLRQLFIILEKKQINVTGLVQLVRTNWINLSDNNIHDYKWLCPTRQDKINTLNIILTNKFPIHLIS